MSMPIAQPSVTKAPTSFEFELKPGQESVALPYGYAHPSRVWLVDIRRRRVFLHEVSSDAFAEMAPTLRLSTGDTATVIRGMPQFFCIHAKECWLWPVPKHAWTGGMER